MEIELKQRLAEDDNHLRIPRFGVGRSSWRIASMAKTGEVEESRASFQLWCYFLRSQMSLCLSTANHWSHFKTVWKIPTDWQDGTGLGFSNRDVCIVPSLLLNVCNIPSLLTAPARPTHFKTLCWLELGLPLNWDVCFSIAPLHSNPAAQTQSTLRDCLPSVWCSL